MAVVHSELANLLAIPQEPEVLAGAVSAATATDYMMDENSSFCFFGRVSMAKIATAAACGALVFATRLDRALANRKCGSIVWGQDFESPSIEEVLQQQDGEAFYPVGDPPGCVLPSTST